MDAKEFAEYKKNCKKCNRKGLPILLTRYAIASKDSNAKKVDGDFKATTDGATQVELDSDTFYTQRFLRQGYVYVYDKENRDAKNRKAPWQGYVVDNRGYLTPFPIPTPPSYDVPAPGSGSAPCDLYANEMMARCISIIDPKKPRTIWIGFSETPWTDAVLKEHEKESTRDRHMRKFDLKKWWDDVAHEHACKIDKCDHYIAEMNSISKQFEFSPAPFNVPRTAKNWEFLAKEANMELTTYPIDGDGKEGAARRVAILKKLHEEQKTNTQKVLLQAESTSKSSLLRVAKNLLGDDDKHKAAIVALDDPAGVLMDLTVYMDYRLQKFIRDTLHVKYERELALTAVIEGMREGMKDDILASAERNANMTDDEIIASYMASGQPVVITDSMIRAARTTAQNRYKRLQDDPKQVQEVANTRWKKYGNKLKPGWEKWKDDYDKDMKDFDQNHILPLIEAYVEWFNGKRYTSYMECNHDPNDQENGVRYSTIVSLCLGSGQEKDLIAEKVIFEQLQASMKDKTKVLARALVTNQEKEAVEIDRIQAEIDAKSEADRAKLALDFMEKTINKAGEAVAALASDPDLLEARHSVLAMLTRQVGSGVVRIAQRAALLGPIPAWLLRMSYVTQMPLMRITVRGNVTEVAAYLAGYYARFFASRGIVVNNGGNGVHIQQNLEAMLRRAGRNNADFTAYVAVNDIGLAQDMQAAGQTGRGGVPNLADQRAAVRGNVEIVSDRMQSRGGQAFNLQESMPVEQFQRAIAHGQVVENSTLRIQEGLNVELYNQRTGAFTRERLPAAASILTAFLQLGILLSAERSLTQAVSSGDGVEISEARMLYAASYLGAVSAVGEGMGALGTFFPLSWPFFNKESLSRSE